LISRVFNHAGRVGTGGKAAALTFWGGNGLVNSNVNAGSDVNQGSFPMTFVNRLSVWTAYLALAFVGAIILGVI
jgi:hypothetical protein